MPDTPLRVLFVEDSEDDALLAARQLQQAGYAPIWRRVETPEDLRAALEEGNWDVILCDFRMPRFDAFRALRIVQERNVDAPFIIVSGTVGEDVAVEAMKAGAHDYVLKGNLTRLPAAVARELREAEVRRARRKAEEQLRKLSRAVEQGPGVVVILDPEGRIEYVNPRFTQISLFAPEDVLGMTADVLGDLLSPEEQEALRTTLRTGGTWQGERRARRKDGSFYWALLTISPVRDEDGAVTHYVIVAEDITARREAEEREREARSRAERQLQRLQALRLVDLSITSSLDLRVTLSVILDQVTAHLGVDAACVRLMDPHLHTLEYAYARGFRSTAPLRVAVRLGEGHAGQAALERRLISVPEFQDASGEGFVAYVAVPLVAKAQVKGVLELFHRRPPCVDEEWFDFLESIATQAAVAVDNAALFDELERANTDLRMAYDTTLEGWSRALDLRDRDTEGHTRRVAELTVRLARVVGVREADLVHIWRGALLHDIGKIGIPDSILHKPGPLTDEEWEVMRRHPVYAYELLSPIEFLRPALEIPYSHHERWDGTGYPRGLRGEQIPLSARIFAVVDVYDALTSERPYRSAWPSERALAYIREQAGTQFDPRVVEAFIHLTDLDAPNPETLSIPRSRGGGGPR